jgi:hypothetical protein
MFARLLPRNSSQEQIILQDNIFAHSPFKARAASQIIFTFIHSAILYTMVWHGWYHVLSILHTNSLVAVAH